ncbi:MAG TPA: SRPBCC domain-containing protein [Actinomycetota bacterium]|nr:SRPBCC domain-containing protein [Actinomycetota bacterium]
MKEIIHTVEIKAPVASVEEALTTESGLSSWWTQGVSVQGDRIAFTFEEGFNPVMRVEHREPGKLVAWAPESGADPWMGSTIRFELGERDGRTGILFRHRYGQDLPDEMFGVFNFNWAYYLESLRQLCEEGTGKPFQPEE